MGVVGVGVERQVRAVLLDRADRQQGDIDLLETLLCLRPGQLAEDITGRIVTLAVDAGLLDRAFRCGSLEGIGPPD